MQRCIHLHFVSCFPKELLEIKKATMLFIFHNVIGYSSSILPLYWYLSGISQVV